MTRCNCESEQFQGRHAPECALVIEGEADPWSPIAEMNLAQMQRLAMEECVTANWGEHSFAEELMFLASEVSEAFEAWRDYHDFEIRYGPDGKPEGIPIELADVLIGILYNAEKHGFDLAEAFEIKHRFNLTRDYQASPRAL